MEEKTLFYKNITDWNNLDKKIKAIQENLLKLKEEKNIIKNNIIKYVEEEKLNNTVVKIDDNQLRFIKYKQIQPLTFKFLKTCLNNCILDTEQVELLIQYIKEQRSSIEYLDIKSSK